ncbi:radical SAM protein [Candidatus Omnitrophota bacterium]
MDIDKKLKLIDKILPGFKKSMESCDLCPRNCKIDRTKGEKGYCRSGANALVHSSSPHHGEEPPLSGHAGSGTIFFSNCNMGCVYCQNYQFSQHPLGKEVSPREFADMMLDLQEEGCHNINFVTPTHFVTPIVEALKYAYADGLKLPTVYNTGGYDSPRVIRSLDGIIDIYMPDMRYASNEMAEKYSCAPGYVEVNRNIVKEMHKQVGVLNIEKGIAVKGLIIRLLMLPGGLSGTTETLEFIAGNLSKDSYLSVMSQYYPAYKAASYKELDHRISWDDHKLVTEKMDELGLSNGWQQPFFGGFDDRFAGENFTPDL